MFEKILNMPLFVIYNSKHASICLVVKRDMIKNNVGR